MFATASLGVYNLKPNNQRIYKKGLIQPVKGKGPYSLKIGGQISHSTSDVIVDDPTRARYAQIYIY